MNSAVIRRKLSDEVVSRLEALVTKYPVGTSLPSERELMALYQVGRPSVREALHTLETKGLVQIRSGDRAKVSRPTPDGMLDQLSGAARLLLDQPSGVLHFEQLRLFLEEGIVRHAALHATEAQLTALNAALAVNERAIPQARLFAETDVAFHRLLMELPSNPIFVAVHQALVDWLISQHIPKADPLGNRRAFEGHRVILDAIKRRDPEAAGLAMREHLMAARRRYAAPTTPETRD